MKKILIILFLPLLLAQGLGAQYVTIPDANFRARLMQALPTCFNAQQELDTTCAAIGGLTILAVNSASIGDLDGVQYLDALTQLYCYNNQLTYLPTLPANLQYLVCNRNQLGSLPNLPVNLLYLWCANNPLGSLPPNLPSNLSTLDCDSNQLASLPSLPSSLLHLECGSNQLTSLPTLPGLLRELWCYVNQLTSLPTLPAGLQSLVCYNNQLTNLPNLPGSLRALSFNNNNISSVPSLPASLRYLTCSFNQLTSLPSLPASLEQLLAESNQLTSLPNLPASLSWLRCNNNQLTSLPPLPASLDFLQCNNNLLISLPPLPATLMRLECGNNQLTTLPNLTNTILFSLHCENNQLINLPNLPSNINIQTILCQNNQLISLPNLSMYTNMVSLNCNNNKLTSLPLLPAGLRTLQCNNNFLTNLPPLPADLRELFCSNNEMINLPALPNTLVWLHCNSNPFLSCLPLLPAGLQQLDVTQTSVTCLPNNTTFITAGTFAANFLPLCTGPQQICTTDYPWAVGNTYQDLNTNGQFDPGEPRVGGVQVNGPVWPTFSTANTAYWAYLLPSTLNSLWANSSFPAWTIAPDTLYVNAPPTGQAQDTLNFGLTPAGPNSQDLQVALATGVARPGFNTSASASVFNAGTAPQAVTFSMTFPAGWTLLSTIPAGGAVTGNTVTWQTPNPLGLFEGATFGLVLNVPAMEPLGTPFAYTASANQPVGEVTPLDNSASFSDDVQGAYDPNDKLVSPETLPPGYDPEQELIYTIRFQNTGTDTAFHVLIRDTLANTLRPETFRMMHSSHTCVPGFEGLRHLYFTFPNILLVDSFTNEPASHGFVQFAIKPVAGLPPNTVLANRAGIYFDFNAPIITNYAETQVFLGAPQVPGGAPLTVRVFPNPAEQSTRFELDAPLAGPATLTLFNALGQAVRGLELPAGALGTELQRDGLPAGLYFFELADGDALRVAGRLVWR